MDRRQRNGTITLDEGTVRWARVEADRRGTSVSKLVGEILRAEMGREAQYEAARQTYLAQEPGVHRSPDQPLPLPLREELYEP